MDKDRDISRTITLSTPRKVGFVGSAVLAGSALLAACGGGSSKPANTPEGGVGGVDIGPGRGASPIIVETAAMPSATAVREAPTVAPTATAEAQLTQEQINQVASQVKDLISGGLSDTQVTEEAITQAGGDSRYLNPQYIAQAIANCDMSKYGQPFYSVNLDMTIDPSARNYSSVFLINCAQPADAAKALFKATGDPRFKNANSAWKPVNRVVFEGVRTKDTRIDESTWTEVESRYYITQ